MKFRRRFWFILAAAGLLAGCEHSGSNPLRASPQFEPRNYLGDLKLPASIRRVVLLPVHGGEFASTQTTESLDQVFATALEQQMRFEVVMLSREECEKSYGVPDLSSAASLPHDFLADLGAKFGAQAVMFVDLTAYEAYRPMTLGVRAKLALVADRHLVWSFDQVFSTTDPTVVNSMRRFYQRNELGAAPVDLSEDNLQSPGRFAAYAATTAFRTLPPR